MVNTGRNINACAGTNLHGRLIVNHLFALPGYNIDNLFRTGMIMSCVPFSLRQFNDTETEAVRIGDRRFAEEVDFSPVKFHAIDILSGSDNARSKFLKSGRFFFLYHKILRRPKSFCWKAKSCGRANPAKTPSV